MEKEIEIFRDNVDAWIKQIRSEYSDMRDLDLAVAENTDNIQFNYELIHELREEVEILRKELTMVKVLQLVSMKSSMKQEEIKNSIQ